MYQRPLQLPPDYIYPTDEWRLVERRFAPEFLARSETLFATANGYLGIRGTFEEGTPVSSTGTFVNGFHETWPIVYGEAAFGFAKTGQTMVPVTDGSVIRLYVDEDPFDLSVAELQRYERALDMRTGQLSRELVWETASGKKVQIRSRRLVSFSERHLAAICYEVTLLNAPAPIVISSELRCHGAEEPKGGGGHDPRRNSAFAQVALSPLAQRSNEHRMVLTHRTTNSRLAVACGADHVLEFDGEHSFRRDATENGVKVGYSMEAKPGETVRLVKYLAYHWSGVDDEELMDRCDWTLDRARRSGFEELAAQQRRYLDEFWEKSDVQVGGEPSIQQAIRFNLFHILQATARSDGGGLGAKGLTGPGYEGHSFWDTEIYVLPFLTYTSPRIARNLLRFRAGMLDKARDRAREVNQKGALFPWRTINGEEASAYYAAGTAQYHINADVVQAFRKYVEATGDDEFRHFVMPEVLIETARLWRDLGFFSTQRDGRFCINGVTGPDEYNTVVNNNTFTNLMARENLWFASAQVARLREEAPDEFLAVAGRTRLDESEIEEWRRAADRMFVPFDEKEGVHLQDDQFLDRKPWDFENTPPESYPLLLHFHPLVIYRHKVIKQADVVLAMFLLGDEFSDAQKSRNFFYYDEFTTGDSSLSACIQAIMAAEVGDYEKATKYAGYALLMDLADVAGNIRDGCHIASMGGTWMVLVYGWAGFRDHGGSFRFRPRRLARMTRLTFPLTLRGSRLSVDIRTESVVYTLVSGPGVRFRHGDESIELTPESPGAERPTFPWSPDST